MPEINHPEVVAEIATLHDAYERALALNDQQGLNDFFWNSDHAVRYGLMEHLYGSGAIQAYRQQTTAPVFTERVLFRRTIVAFGADTASVMSEFKQKVGGQPKHSRQSQVWIRFAGVGWKIASAHVSNALSPQAPLDWAGYVVQVAPTVGLSLSPSLQKSVAQAMERNAAIAAALLDFNLPDDVEPAAVFTA